MNLERLETYLELITIYQEVALAVGDSEKVLELEKEIKTLNGFVEILKGLV